MTNPNEPAYLNNGSTKGLTKREVFAAMAMQGLLSKEGFPYQELVERAVVVADELINTLNQHP